MTRSRSTRISNVATATAIVMAGAAVTGGIIAEHESTPRLTAAQHRELNTAAQHIGQTYLAMLKRGPGQATILQDASGDTDTLTLKYALGPNSFAVSATGPKQESSKALGPGSIDRLQVNEQLMTLNGLLRRQLTLSYDNEGNWQAKETVDGTPTLDTNQVSNFRANISLLNGQAQTIMHDLASQPGLEVLSPDYHPVPLPTSAGGVHLA